MCLLVNYVHFRVTSEAEKLIDLRDDFFRATICQNILEGAKEVIDERVQMLQKAVDEQGQAFSNSNQDLRPPRLPMELVAKIISFVPDCGKTKRWPGSSSVTVIYGWLPHIYISPSLPLEIGVGLSEGSDVGRLAHEVQEIVQITSICFSVSIDAYRDAVQKHEHNLGLLLQYPHRWKRLCIGIHDNASSIPSILLKVASCLPYIKEFSLSIWGKAWTTCTDLGPLFDKERLHLTGQLLTATFDWQLFRPFLDIGLHHSIKELSLYDDRNSDRFPDCLQLLSELPCLELLSIHMCDKVSEGTLALGRVTCPESLRILELHNDWSEDCAISFLRLFEGSLIEEVYFSLEAISSEELAFVLNDTFTGLKQLKLSCCSVSSILSPHSVHNDLV